MKNIERIGLLTLTLLLGIVVAFAQGDTLSGKYEGTLKSAGAPDEKISLELKNEGGKISGRATHGTKTIDVTEGKLENGTLSLSFGKEAVFTAKVDGDKLVGDLVAGTNKHSVELKKVLSPAPAAAPATPAAPAAVNLNGEWDCVADVQGQPFPFSLVLKVDGETVTGSGSSQLGETTVKSGSWKDGKLVFQLEGSNSVISMSAVVVEGRLTGDYDYAGQTQGKWYAVKKN